MQFSFRTKGGERSLLACCRVRARVKLSDAPSLVRLCIRGEAVYKGRLGRQDHGRTDVRNYLPLLEILGRAIMDKHLGPYKADLTFHHGLDLTLDLCR